MRGVNYASTVGGNLDETDRNYVSFMSIRTPIPEFSYLEFFWENILEFFWENSRYIVGLCTGVQVSVTLSLFKNAFFA